MQKGKGIKNADGRWHDITFVENQELMSHHSRNCQKLLDTFGVSSSEVMSGCHLMVIIVSSHQWLETLFHKQKDSSFLLLGAGGIIFALSDPFGNSYLPCKRKSSLEPFMIVPMIAI